MPVVGKEGTPPMFPYLKEHYRIGIKEHKLEDHRLTSNYSLK